MIFWRILDNTLYIVDEVKKLGWPKDDPFFIPDEYLDKQEFMIMRTCHGLGDWGIISAMPRLLKQKYPKCKVYVPSETLLRRLFGELENNWGVWNNPFSVVNSIFKNNPYVDEVVDEIKGEVFHDHYRIYDPTTPNIPLLKQILTFWQFSDNEMVDIQPELYWTDEEKKIGNDIIKKYIGNDDFGTLLISDKYDYTQDKLILNVLNQHNSLKYFYFTALPIEQTDFNCIQKALDLHHVPIRIQLYIRSKAKINIGNQCGVLDCIPRYSTVYTVQRQFPLEGNFVDGEIYLDDKQKRVLLKDVPDKFDTKTTTSRKFKSDLIDFLGDRFKDKNIIEIGCSLGHTTKILSEYFNKVVAVDFDPTRIQLAKEFNKTKNNIIYITKDVYRTPWKFDINCDAVFIDCVHEYNHVKSDILNSIQCFKSPLLIFDDYGLFPHEVKKCIDDFVKQGTLKIIKKIGYKKGVIFPKTKNKIMTDHEGVICEVHNQ